MLICVCSVSACFVFGVVEFLLVLWSCCGFCLFGVFVILVCCVWCG